MSEFAHVVVPTLLTTKEAAEVVRQSPKTLEFLRWRGGGPRYIALSSRAVRYDLVDLVEWLEDNKRTSTSDDTRVEG